MSYAKISGSDSTILGGVIGKIDTTSAVIQNNRYANAEHGIGYNAQGVSGEEGCIRLSANLTITTGATLPDGRVNSSYSQALTATGTGASTVTWDVRNGSLPSGITLNSNGTISGTPTEEGTFEFTVRALGTTTSATKTFTLKINGAGSVTPPSPTAITITTTSLSAGRVGTSYSGKLTANPSDVTWSVLSGSLPAGLRLNSSTGAITGTPTAAGTSVVTFQAAKSGYTLATKTLTIEIGILPLITIQNASLPEGTVTENYSATLTADVSGVTWSMARDNYLPRGLSLNRNTGVISGTPAVAVTMTLTFEASKSGYTTASKALSLTIKPEPLKITTERLRYGVVLQGYSGNLSANYSDVKWSIDSGRLPEGLELNSDTGTLLGTPVTEGTSTFTVKATRGYETATKLLTLTILASSSEDIHNDNRSSGGGGCNFGYGILGLAVYISLLLKKQK